MKKISMITIICVLSAFMVYGSISIFGPKGNDTSIQASALDQKDNILLATKSYSDFPSTDSLKTLTKDSDIVVIGEFSRFIQYWNMARDPSDPYNLNKEDPNLYVKGGLYEFTIDEYLKSNDKNEKKITVNIPVSRNETIYEDYFEPIIGEKVVLFLVKSEFTKNYYGTEEPYRFSIDLSAGEDSSLPKKIKVKTNFKDIKDLFEGGKELNLSEFIDKVKNTNK